jgi:hypothetical protein
VDGFYNIWRLACYDELDRSAQSAKRTASSILGVFLGKERTAGQETEDVAGGTNDREQHSNIEELGNQYSLSNRDKITLIR